LEGQLDLSLRQTEPGLTLFENAVWAPTTAVLAKAPPVAGDPTSLALAADLSNAEPLPTSPSAPAGPGSLFLSEAHDSRWRATQSGRRLSDAPAFGWANSYPLASGPVRVHFAGGSQRALALGFQIVAWLALLFLLTRARWRRGRGGHGPPVKVSSMADPGEIDVAELMGAAPHAVSEVAR
jgi:hypothetical protein